MANFDVELNDEVENFTVEFGEVQRITVDDFDKLRNRPSYAGQTMTHETNIPEVPTAVSQLTNDADYQTGSEVESAISTAVGGEKDAREQADAGLSRDIGVVDGKVDAEADARERADIALQGAIDDEETARKNADNGLQGQIDAITSSSDVVDIVGTYAELLQYPTAGLGDKDVIKVLQDETHNDAMSYYRWNKSSSTWSYIGSEGPYYTKSETNTLLGDKQDTLTAGSNITISSNNTISATDTTYTAGNGLTLTGTEFSADTTVLQPKLTAGDGINISAQNVISADIDPADFFTASETVDGTGSEITLNNTIQAKIKSVQMDGDTFQQTYSGKNLFNFGQFYANRADFTVNDGTINITENSIEYAGHTASGSQFYPAHIVDNKSIYGMENLQPSTTYTISYDATGDTQCWVFFFNSANTRTSVNQIFSTTRVSYTFTTPADLSWYTVRLDNRTTSNTISNIQIEVGSGPATSYEPYTGGHPAPSPDFPEPINVVTGDQTVEVTGKNLFNPNNFVLGKRLDGNGNFTNDTNYFTSDYIPVTPSTTYTYSRYQSGGGSACVCMYDENQTFLQRIFWNGSAYINLKYISFDTTASTYYVRFCDFKSLSNLQLETGSISTAYQPFYSQTYTIDLNTTELCKIGDYQDYIYKNGDDWYVHKATARVDVSSLSGWFASGSYAYKTRNGMSDILPASSDSATAVGLCNAFSASTTNLVYAGSVDYGFALPGAGGTGILIRNKNVTSLADFTTYLSNNPVYGYFALATPTDTKITDATLISGLDALADALGYKDKTIITVSATGTNLPAILEVSAYRNSLAGVLGVIGRAEAA